jgi:demethylphylloquinone reductase
MRQQKKIKICILGGGFGGLYTALYLAKAKKVLSGEWEIILVEPKDNFLFTPLLYEIITDELKRWEIAPNYQKLLVTSNIKWLQRRVQQISLENREIYLENQSLLNYDYLVLAVGRKIKFADILGLDRYALTFRSIFDAELLKKRLQLLKSIDKQYCYITVIGAGANGVELACKIYDFFRQNSEENSIKITPVIYLIDKGTEILKSFNQSVKDAAYKAIKQRKINILLATDVVEIAENKITLQEKTEIREYPVDLILWTGGTTNHNWITSLPLQYNELGQILTRSTLQVMDYSEVLALGDVADIYSNKVNSVPTTAQAAYQQASTAARNLQAMIQNKPLKKFSYLHLGDMLTLGKGKAIISSFGINISGKLGGFIRRLIYIQRLPTMSHRLQVLKNLLFG